MDDRLVEMFIEVSAGSTECRKYNEETFEYRSTRTTPVPYPYAYGFIPGTRSTDGDCLDCYLISKRRFDRAERVLVRPAGLLRMTESGDNDDKVVALLPGDPLPHLSSLRNELESFISTIFSVYPDITVEIGTIDPADTAWRLIESGRIRE